MLNTIRSRAARARQTQAARTFKHIGILNDYVRIPFAAGSSFAAQLLHSEFTKRGHEVTLVGARDPQATEEELPRRHVLFPGIPVPSQPGFFLPLPSPSGLGALANERFDVILGQTGSSLMSAGIWLRTTQRIPLLCVNTAMLASLYDTVLPEGLHENETVQKICKEHVVPVLEQASVRGYNQSDGLIVLSAGLKRYWRDLGVRVPIHVIPRAVDPRVVHAPIGTDPFHPRAKPGHRILVLCRLVREKGIARLIDIFAKHVAPKNPDATLTFVGDGADHDAFRARAERLGVADRTFFPGEFPVTDVRTWYTHADLFMYASMSETYGQVVSEAMYCGLPVVAFDDRAGVAQQINHGENGILLPPGPDKEAADLRFAAEIRDLLDRPQRRRQLGEAAHASAVDRADVGRCIERYYAVFDQARRHRDLSPTPTDRLSQIRPLLSWTAMHSFVGAAGLVRPASILNRYGRKQPVWTPIPTAPVASEADSKNAAA